MSSSDLGILLSAWGTAKADLDGDGLANDADRALLERYVLRNACHALQEMQKRENLSGKNRTW